MLETRNLNIKGFLVYLFWWKGKERQKESHGEKETNCVT